jgi:hypothetical protein
MQDGAMVEIATVGHYRKYKTFAKQLQTSADLRGYVMLDQCRPGDIDVFYPSGSTTARWSLHTRLSPRARATKG